MVVVVAVVVVTGVVVTAVAEAAVAESRLIAGVVVVSDATKSMVLLSATAMSFISINVMSVVGHQ